MDDKNYVANFEALEVYVLSKDLCSQIFKITMAFPKHERYSLTDQIRRSSRSIGAQIAESWGKRRYQLHFISKLTDADAEQLETQHWINIALICHYLTADQAEALLKKSSSIGKMLQMMINKSDRFCKSTK